MLCNHRFLKQLGKASSTQHFASRSRSGILQNGQRFFIQETRRNEIEFVWTELRNTHGKIRADYGSKERCLWPNPRFQIRYLAFFSLARLPFVRCASTSGWLKTCLIVLLTFFVAQETSQDFAANSLRGRTQADIPVWIKFLATVHEGHGKIKTLQSQTFNNFSSDKTNPKNRWHFMPVQFPLSTAMANDMYDAQRFSFIPFEFGTP